MKALQKLAVTYLIVVGIAAAWTCYVEVSSLHSNREHLLPAIVLMFVTSPASWSAGPIYTALPTIFSAPFVQIGWFVFCGFGQAALIFLAGGFGRRRGRNEAKKIDKHALSVSSEELHRKLEP